VGLGLPLRASRAVAVDRAAAWRLALGGLVVGSVVLRTWAAWQRVTPNYFPDESIYATLSRSIAHGHLPAVRGQVAHFPALLQPLLTAPAWWFGSLETGYRATQAIESVAVSTAALAMWWTARRLGLGRGSAFAAAAIALAVPDAGYTGWILAEPFAYPLFIAAIGAGTVALAAPTRRAQGLFLGLVLLASLARMQLAVLLVVYVVAAAVLRRLGTQRVVLGALGLALVFGVAGGLGYYRGAPSALQLVGPATVGRNLLVLALAAGWVIVPAGLLGLCAAAFRPRTEIERCFGVLAGAALLAVVGISATYGVVGVVHERYGAYALPLVALGFVLFADRGWPWQRAHAVLAVFLLTAAAATPMSGWAEAGGNAHSLVLTALLEVEKLGGSAGAGGFYVVTLTGLLSVAAILCAWRRATAVATVLAVGFCVATSAFATTFDAQNSRNVRASFLPAGPQWIANDSTVVAANASRTSVLEQLFWNTKAKHLAVLDGASPPDVFAVTATSVTKDGSLAGVSGPVVLDEDGSALVPVEPGRWNGTWLAAGSPKLRAVVSGRGGDGWLAPTGTVRMFGPGALRFWVTAPEPMTLTVDGRAMHIPAHTRTQVYVCTAGGDFSYSFSKHGYVGFRAVSARSTFPRVSAC
jgi:hypothetical protein